MRRTVDTLHDRMQAGAGVFYPGVVPGHDVVHLGRTEARKGREPALFAICPGGPVDELDRAAARRIWHRVKWCPSCKSYADHVREEHGER